jgi:hypothetical protein
MVKCGPAEKFKKLGVWAVMGMMTGGPYLCDKSMFHCLRIIVETAPSPWLAECSATKSYLLAMGACDHVGLRNLYRTLGSHD